jgi:hypothetical protein
LVSLQRVSGGEGAPALGGTVQRSLYGGTVSCELVRPVWKGLAYDASPVNLADGPRAAGPCQWLTGGSCTSSLRIIRSAQKPGKMPSFHCHVRGRYHDAARIFLPVGVDRTRVALCDVVCRVAKPTNTPEQRSPTPSVRPRKPSNAPKPFTGLTHKPHCAACEQSAAQPKLPALVPPAPMPVPKRRPRQVDTSQHFCPHPTCNYHNFVLPHASVRQPLRAPEATNGRGSGKGWQPCTPAMAAGLTDHIGTLREVLLCRVPTWPQPQAL